jgi:hypothetical protein
MYHFALSLQPPELSSLLLSWQEWMELSVGQRDVLAELLDEHRTQEIQAQKRAMRRR